MFVFSDWHGGQPPWERWARAMAQELELPELEPLLLVLPCLDLPQEQLALQVGALARLARLEPGFLQRFSSQLLPALQIVRAVLRCSEQARGPHPLDPAWASCGDETLMLALAGSQGRTERLAEVRDALARPALLGALDLEVEAAVGAALSCLPGGARGAESCRQIAREVSDAWRYARSYLILWGLAHAAAPAWGWGDAREALEDALAWLRESAPWRDAWELRRRGLLGAPGPLVGSWFGRGFVLRVLVLLGELSPQALRAHLDEIPDQGPRWFGAWQGIPPDADSLALALELAALCDYPQERVEGWLGNLLASLDAQGLAPTWFTRDAQGRTTVDPPENRYLGDDCVAVRLALVRGLLSWNAPRFMEFARLHLADLARRRRAGQLGGLFFYTAPWAELLLWGLPIEAPGLSRQGALDHLVASQGADGGWGSPQDTALRLIALGPSLPEGARLRACRALCATRSPDGSWPAEPFYRMPGPGRGQGECWFSSVSITTAICAWALACGLRG